MVRHLASQAFAAAVVAVLSAPLSLRAQTGHAATTPLARADSMAAAGDTSGAIAVLERAVRARRDDASAWHRLGMLAWAQVRSDSRGIGMSQETISFRRMADSSLRLAMRIAPDSGRFQLDFGRYCLFADLITMRAQAGGHFERALEDAKRSGDRPLIAEAADELGMISWRRYEAVADRRVMRGMESLPTYQMLDEPHGAANFIENFTITPPERPGQLDYLKATDLFHEGLVADPNDERVVRHGFMALAEERQWEQLRAAATARLAASPGDATAWLALGLATHRLGQEERASQAFDSALARLSPEERARYTNLSRILGPEDSTHFRTLSAEERADAERVYWTFSDPLTLTPSNEHRVEFLARTTFADLRWSSDDYDLRGADTDRGQIWIRYGPAPVIASFAPPAPGSRSCVPGLDPGTLDCSRINEAGVASILWYYPIGNFHFVFRAPPSYGLASFSGDYASVASDLRATHPVSWSNLEIDRQMDSVGVQAARFRGPGDSLDLAVFADVPVRRLVAGVDIASGPVDMAFTVFDGLAHRLVRDSSRQRVNFTHPDAAERRSWRHRFAPRPLIRYRVEARQPDAGRAARATGSLSLPASHGFGLSDVVVADRVSIADSAAGEPARWTGFLITPSAGTLRSGQPVDLLWETYDLAAAGGVNRYRVEIALTVLSVTRPSNFLARVVGGAADALGLSAKGDQRVALTYPRERPARQVQVDHLRIELGDAPPGQYSLAVQITDLVTGKHATTTRQLTVIE